MLSKNMEKSKKIQKMFSLIAGEYDFLNHLLSLGQDIFWRKKVANLVKQYKFEKIVDIACGTGDLSIEILKKTGKNITGIDFCLEMLKIAKEKTDKIYFLNGDATNLPVKKDCFNCITIAFGIRNIPQRDKALKEFYRILNNKGMLFILEFDIPENFFFRFYFKKVLPFIGGLFSSKEAYTYLPDSVEKFPREKEFVREIENAGFKIFKIFSYSMGTVKLYISKKDF